MRWNQAPFRPVYRGATVNDILLKLTFVRYLSLTVANSDYFNLKFDEKSSYLIIFACQVGRFSYARLPFGAVPASNMFQRKITEIFKELHNVFGPAGYILVVGHDIDGINCDTMLRNVLHLCK